MHKLSGQVQHIEAVLPNIDYHKAEENWANIFGYLSGQDMPWIIRKISRLQFSHNYAFGSKGRLIAEGIVGKDEVTLKKYLAQRKTNLEIFNDFFKQYSFIISPVGVGPAFEHCKTGKPIMVEGRKVNYWEMCLPFTFVANVLGFPTLVIPLGKSKDNLPIGIQIMGPYHSEKQLIKFTKLLEPYVQGYQKAENFI